MWLIDLLRSPFRAQVEGLEAIVKVLRSENESLRERIREFEVDDREIRRGSILRAPVFWLLLRKKSRKTEN